MSKKDYQAIARAVNTARMGSNLVKEDVLVRELSAVLSADNPRFDRARFMEACETGSCKGMRRQLPQCARAMGCLCAKHARGATFDATCDASE